MYFNLNVKNAPFAELLEHIIEGDSIKKQKKKKEKKRKKQHQTKSFLECFLLNGHTTRKLEPLYTS